MVRFIKNLSPPGNGRGSVHLSTREPAPPPEASFAIYIDFAKGEANPQRIFQAADAMIRALQQLDNTLCTAIDTKIEPIMVLEEIETGSIKIWLSNQLNRIDDDGLKKLDWKPIVGQYLVDAKYAFVKWANKDAPAPNLLSLTKELRTLAQDTDIKHIPDYAPPDIHMLAESVKRMDAAKALLIDGDKISYISKDNPPVSFDLAVKWSVEELTELTVKVTTKFADSPMLLIVKKPDYLGSSKWDLRHGKKTISARIEDQEWLRQFQSRRVDVRPGDALNCVATIINSYGFDNELVSEEFVITKVNSVLENQATQEDFDFGS